MKKDKEQACLKENPFEDFYVMGFCDHDKRAEQQDQEEGQGPAGVNGYFFWKDIEDSKRKVIEDRNKLYLN